MQFIKRIFKSVKKVILKKIIKTGKMKKQEIIHIANIGENRELGKDNDLVFFISEDLKRFKEFTTGNTLISGRKTFESFPKILPNRNHIIVTRDKNYSIADAESIEPYQTIITHSIKEAIGEAEKLGKDIYIAGGGEIYKQTINLADRLELTHTEAAVANADTYYPNLDNFICTDESVQKFDKKSGNYYIYKTWKRKR